MPYEPYHKHAYEPILSDYDGKECRSECTEIFRKLIKKFKFLTKYTYEEAKAWQEEEPLADNNTCDNENVCDDINDDCDEDASDTSEDPSEDPGYETEELIDRQLIITYRNQHICHGCRDEIDRLTGTIILDDINVKIDFKSTNNLITKIVITRDFE